MNNGICRAINGDALAIAGWVGVLAMVLLLQYTFLPWRNADPSADDNFPQLIIPQQRDTVLSLVAGS